jgi:hypothetical protein
VYQSFLIENFRCFRRLRMKDLARVNLIVGKNNVGKTALLEAFALVTRPDLDRFLVASVWRGDAVRELRELPTLFRDLNALNTINLVGIEPDGTKRRLTLTADENEKSRIEQGEATPVSFYMLPDASWLIHSRATYGDLSVDGKHSTGGKKSATQDTIPWVMPLVGQVPVVQPQRLERAAEAFGRLVYDKREAEVIEVVRVVEPRLKELKTVPGVGSMRFVADIGTASLIPVSLLGEGTLRVLSLALVIIAAKGGIVLVDEIEDGIHYGALVGVWERVAELSRRYGTQVFATTHSYECIVAAHEAFAESEPYDLRIHRLEGVGDDIEVVTIDGETMAGVTEIGAEIR